MDTTRSAPKRFVAPARRRQQQNRLRQLNARRGQNQKDNQENAGRYNQPQRTRRRNNNWRGHRHNNWQNRVDRQASVAVQPTWNKVDEFELKDLAKLKDVSPPSEEDLLWCGFLDQYNDSYDKVNTKVSVPLKRSETKEFYPVTTTDDPVIEKLAIEGTGNVFATDAILAHLMASPRSVYPWDIVVQKLPGSGALFFDKRDSSQFDYLTVSETSNNPPLSKTELGEGGDADGDINSPERLSLEATMINQNFSQQILRNVKTREHFDLPNPFYDEDDDEMEPASVAYRYRRFNMANDSIKLVVRTELHGVVKKGASSSQYMTAFALNEFNNTRNSQQGHNNAGSINWRDKIDSQRGAVLATEIRNNSCKLAKWTAQSLLAGADQMKIGFVSRAAKNNAYEHVILATQFSRPMDFAMQITLSVGNMWAIIEMLVNLFKNRPEGKYVLMRDPNRPVVRLYSVPPDTFEEEDSDEDSDEEEEEEEEEE